MKERLVDADISIVPYYPNPAVTLPWYQDADVCKQVDNIDHVYSPERLEAMYTFLSTHGDCFYIIYRGKPIGDVTLRDNGELAIVVSKAWQNRGIGRRCIREMLRLAKEKGVFRRPRQTCMPSTRRAGKCFKAAGSGRQKRNGSSAICKRRIRNRKRTVRRDLPPMLSSAVPRYGNSPFLSFFPAFGRQRTSSAPSTTPFSRFTTKSCTFVTMEIEDRLPRSRSLLTTNSEISTA